MIFDQRLHRTARTSRTVRRAVRDMPRLSIDIDLIWLPVEFKNAALDNMSSALNKVSDLIRTKIPGTMVIRGTVFPCEQKGLCKAAEDMFDRLRISSERYWGCKKWTTNR